MLRVRTRFTGLGGLPGLATFNFLPDDTQADANAAHAAVTTFWASLASSLASALGWETQSDVTIVGPSGDVQGQFQVPATTGFGLSSSEPLPFTAQALVQWHTGVVIGSRLLRGRTFIPGIPEVGSNSGTLRGTERTAIQNAANALIAAAGTDLAVWSRSAGEVRSVDRATVWTQFASLRSRRD